MTRASRPADKVRAKWHNQILPQDRRVVRAAGLDPDVVVRHTFRHTAVTHLVQAGVDLPTVQKISGHKTLSMVARYAHANGAHIDAAMDKLETRMIAEKVIPITPELHKGGSAA